MSQIISDEAYSFDFMVVNDRLFNMDVVVFRRIMTSKIGTKIVVTDAFASLHAHMPKNAFGAAPRTPLGKLTTLSQTSSWIWGPLCGEEGRREKGKEERWRKGRRREGGPLNLKLCIFGSLRGEGGASRLLRAFWTKPALAP